MIPESCLKESDSASFKVHSYELTEYKNDFYNNGKALYADDLWWDIWGATENKKEPLSLRGIGAYTLSGPVLASY